MTPEERAYELALDIVMTKDVSVEGIQRAILEAVEEEREACAVIVANQAALCRPGSASQFKGGYVALHDAWLQIRARSELKQP